jgi:hypothetical protein
MHTVFIRPDIDSRLARQLSHLKQSHEKTQGFFFKSDSQKTAQAAFEKAHDDALKIAIDEFPEIAKDRIVGFTEISGQGIVVKFTIPCRS